jgi:hypothetical protein
MVAISWDPGFIHLWHRRPVLSAPLSFPARSSLAVLLVLMALAAADIPFPPSGKLPFPGGLALLNGAPLSNPGSSLGC